MAPLTRLGSPTGVTYIHPLGLDTDGHQPEPAPAADLHTLARRCDFCGDPHPVWELTGGDTAAVATSPTSQLIQHYGDRWAACATCETHINTGRPELLAQRAAAALGWRAHRQGRQRIAELHATFLCQLQPVRTLLTTTAWPADPIPARDLPRVRDRLTQLWRSEHALPAPINHPDLRDAIADGLQRARLYWIDPEFTDLADHAAQQLPHTAVEPDDLPSGDGLLVWASPVADNIITAASWTTTPGGLQLLCHRTIGAGLHGPALQRLREQVGWLVPLPPTGQQADRHLAPLVATCLLLSQRVTHTTTAQPDPATRRRYARAGRPTPEVRIIGLQTRISRHQHADAEAPGSGRGTMREREWVSEHWKQQPYGPGRTRHKLIYIVPYIRGPEDAPIHTRTTVRILGITRTHRPNR